MGYSERKQQLNTQNHEKALHLKVDKSTEVFLKVANYPIIYIVTLNKKSRS